jgi:hypothetical protein
MHLHVFHSPSAMTDGSAPSRLDPENAPSEGFETCRSQAARAAFDASVRGVIATPAHFP